jgi:hypothetical protein
MYERFFRQPLTIPVLLVKKSLRRPAFSTFMEAAIAIATEDKSKDKH